ncbi:unnamed protein product [Withania somnifera]
MDARRPGNYEASIWDHNFGEEYSHQAAKVKEIIKMMLNENDMRLFDQVELVNNLQKLGIHHHFEVKLKRILEIAYLSNFNNCEGQLYAIVFQFRLLRQKGYQVPQEVFTVFMDEEGKFKKTLSMDIKGVLSLYETSYLSIEDESILDMAQEFSIHHLKNYLKQKTLNENVVKQRIERLETRWFMDAYEESHGFNPILFELVKWHKNITLSEMKFTRDRVVELFLWSVGFTSEPKFGYSHIWSTKFGELITIFDDMYELHGTLKELKLFTDIVERCAFQLFFNCINELAYDILKTRNINFLPYLRNSWAELCKIYLVEAKWYNDQHTPISIGGPLLIKHAYICNMNPIEEDDLKLLETNPPLVKWSTLIGRLADDLGTSPKKLQILKHLIAQTWKKMNKEVLMDDNATFFKDFARIAMNFARICQCMYQYGDGYGRPNGETKRRILSLFFETILL